MDTLSQRHRTFASISRTRRQSRPANTASNCAWFKFARIFREYDAGHSTRTIAAGLNAGAIPSPDSGKGGDTWGPSTVSENWKRGTGILNNEL
ncbi:MAG: recombinase family protein, partial [Roseovarius sp.]